MDALGTAIAIGSPLGDVGAAFYFSPEAAARASAIGLDVVSLYAAGRGGVLGDRTPAEVDEAFFFFKAGLIGGVVEAARRTADPADILDAHIGSAADYAVATFSAVDTGVLAAFDAAASRVVAGLETGRWPLVDGYRKVHAPTEPAARAYLQAVLMRELRGGVHREAVVAAGLSAAVACQFDRGDDYYRLHGFGEGDRVPETPEVLATRASAEGATDRAVAGFLAVLDETQAAALVSGVEAMVAAGATVTLPVL